MSAYVVEPEHIAALAQFAHDHECCKSGQFYQSPIESAAHIANCLAQANLNSVAHRYREPDATNNDPFYGDVIGMLKRRHNLQAGDIAEMTACLEYQSCERPDWYESRAFKVLMSIKEEALRQITREQGFIRDYKLTGGSHREQRIA